MSGRPGLALPSRRERRLLAARPAVRAQRAPPSRHASAARPAGFRRLALAVAAAVALAVAAPARAGDDRPGPKEKCPVCGMFVAKYPDWLAGLGFADGSRALFDGPKDLFKFWFEPARYLPDRRREEIVSVFVTDYYTLARLPARAAYFVVGSDVHGPMGRELVPFGTREAAEEFLRDHRGRAVVAFDAVTPELIASLDR